MRCATSSMSLRDLQVSVMAALLDAPPEDLAHARNLIIPAHGAAERLAIYRTNARANFRDALRSTYPAVVRLVGDEYFDQVARELQRRHPSRSGDLTHVGEHFADYLAELHHADGFRYLADIARLEWLIQESLLAPAHGPLDLTKLAAVAPEDYENLHFVVHPSLRLFASRYPALRIWDANVRSDATPDTIDLDSGADRIAILRAQLQLTFHRLSSAEQCMLRSLEDGATFADAVGGAAALDDDFDPSAALQRFVAAGVIVDCR